MHRLGSVTCSIRWAPGYWDPVEDDVVPALFLKILRLGHSLEAVMALFG
jgi:hypothetical protein